MNKKYLFFTILFILFIPILISASKYNYSYWSKDNSTPNQISNVVYFNISNSTARTFNGSKTFYIYNSTGYNKNINNVFIAGDDFNKLSVNTTMWKYSPSATTSLTKTENGEFLDINGTSTTGDDYIIMNNVGYNYNVSMYYRAKYISGIQYSMGIGFFNNVNNRATFQAWNFVSQINFNTIQGGGGISGTAFTPQLNSFLDYQIDWSKNLIKAFCNNTNRLNTTSNIYQGQMNVSLFTPTDATSKTTRVILDYIYVNKRLNNEPTIKKTYLGAGIYKIIVNNSANANLVNYAVNISGINLTGKLTVTDYLPTNYTITAKSRFNNQAVNSFSLKIQNGSTIKYYYTSIGTLSPLAQGNKKKYNITFYNMSDYFNRTYNNYNFSASGNLQGVLNRSYFYISAKNYYNTSMFLNKFNVSATGHTYLNINNATKINCSRNVCAINVTKVNYINKVQFTNRNTSTNPIALLYNLSINSLNLLPVPIYKNMTLRGYCNVSEADISKVQTYYRFYKNSTLNTTGVKSITKNTLYNIANKTGLARYQMWTLSCLANYGKTNTTWMNYSLQVTNAPPSKVILKTPSNNSLINSTSLVKLNWTTATDLEGDSLTYLLFLGSSNSTMSYITTLGTNVYTVPSLSYSSKYFWLVSTFDGQKYINSSYFNFSTPANTGGGNGGSGGGGGGGSITLSNKKNCNIDVTPRDISFTTAGIDKISITNKDTVTYNPAIDVQVKGISKSDLTITNFVTTILVGKSNEFGVQYSGTNNNGTFVITLSDLNCNNIIITGEIGTSIKQFTIIDKLGDLLKNGIFNFLFEDINSNIQKGIEVWMLFVFISFISLAIFSKSIGDNFKNKKLPSVLLLIIFALGLSIIATLFAVLWLRGL